MPSGHDSFSVRGSDNQVLSSSLEKDQSSRGCDNERKFKLFGADGYEQYSRTMSMDSRLSSPGRSGDRGVSRGGNTPRGESADNTRSPEYEESGNVKRRRKNRHIAVPALRNKGTAIYKAVDLYCRKNKKIGQEYPLMMNDYGKFCIDYNFNKNISELSSNDDKVCGRVLKSLREELCAAYSSDHETHEEEDLGRVIQKMAYQLMDELSEQKITMNLLAVKTLRDFCNLLECPDRIGLLDGEYDLDIGHGKIEAAFTKWIEKVSKIEIVSNELTLRKSERKSSVVQADIMRTDFKNKYTKYMKGVHKESDKETIEIVKSIFYQRIKKDYQKPDDDKQRKKINHKIKIALEAFTLYEKCHQIESVSRTIEEKYKVKGGVEAIEVLIYTLEEAFVDYHDKGWKEASRKRCGIK